jgi:CopG family transcriptional regulator/antitoxin EndoAI
VTSKVMVSFPDEFLSEIDRIADEEHRSRSELLREAMRLYMLNRRVDRRSDNHLPDLSFRHDEQHAAPQMKRQDK